MTETAIAVYEPPPKDRGDLLLDPSGFRHGMEVAATLATSQLIPQHFRGKPADVFLAINLSRRMDEDLFTVLQAVHFVHGKPGWYAPFLIARANASGVFAGPLEFTASGEGEALAVTCSGTLKSSGKQVSSTVSMAMARLEGWAKQNAKYQSMPRQMLSYRAATFLLRLYAPGIMYGLPTTDEVEDTGGQVAGVLPHPSPEPAAVLTAQPTGVAAVREALSDPPSSSPQSPTQTGDSDPSGGSGPAAQEAATSEPVVDLDQRDRDRLIGEITKLGVGLPEATRKSLREQHGLQKISPTKADLGKLSRLLAAIKHALADLARHEAWEDPGTPTGEELANLIADLELDASDEVVLEAAKVADLPVGDAGPITDGAPEPRLRRYADEIRKRTGGAS